MSEALSLYVLDTSAWLTLIEDEAGADQVQELLEKARTGEVVVLVSFMSFMEVSDITLQERGQIEAQARVNLMAPLPIFQKPGIRDRSSLLGSETNFSDYAF